MIVVVVEEEEVVVVVVVIVIFVVVFVVVVVVVVVLVLVLKFNVETEETKFIAHSLLDGHSKFHGGVLALNNCIYFIQDCHDKVVKFDPSNDNFTEIGDSITNDRGDKIEWAFNGGVLGDDGNIYCIPHDSHRVLKIRVNDDTTEFNGELYPGTRRASSSAWY